MARTGALYLLLVRRVMSDIVDSADVGIPDQIAEPRSDACRLQHQHIAFGIVKHRIPARPRPFRLSSDDAPLNDRP